MNNASLTFINSVVSSFDNHVYPTVPFNKINHDPLTVKIRKRIPKELQASIHNYSMNLSSWVISTNIVHYRFLDRDAQQAIELSAKDRLTQLKVPLLLLSSKRSQLISHVFEKAYESASVEDKREIIIRLHACQAEVLNSRSCLKRAWIKVQLVACRIFGNGIFISILQGVFFVGWIILTRGQARSSYDSFNCCFHALRDRSRNKERIIIAQEKIVAKEVFTALLGG